MSLWQMPHSYAIAIFRFRVRSGKHSGIASGKRHFGGEESHHAVSSPLPLPR
ncbi:hypothetical protein ACVXHB_30915 [Escherichia coli]